MDPDHRASLRGPLFGMAGQVGASGMGWGEGLGCRQHMSQALPWVRLIIPTRRGHGDGDGRGGSSSDSGMGSNRRIASYVGYLIHAWVRPHEVLAVIGVFMNTLFLAGSRLSLTVDDPR
jgi:hypothetical protein